MYYSTTHLALHVLRAKISSLFLHTRNDPLYKDVVLSMEAKFNKYFLNFSYLFSSIVVMDARAKLAGL